ncbi:MAG: rhodanese-like domain-containing protein [Bacteroidota bacterium]
MNSFRTGLHFTILLVLGASLSILPTGQAQPLVQDPAYDAMLQGLLDLSVPVIGVSQIEHVEDYVFLDAREIKEYQTSHIKNARHVGYDQFKVKSIKDLPKETPIVVYCSVGYRSEKIGEQLLKAGYTNVRNLYGSIFEWVNQGKPVYSDQGITQNVHAYNRVWGIWLKKGQKVYK